MLTPANDIEQEYLWNIQADDIAAWIFIDMSFPKISCSKFTMTIPKHYLRHEDINKLIKSYIRNSSIEEEVAHEIIQMCRPYIERIPPIKYILAHLLVYIRTTSPAVPWEFTTTEQFIGQGTQCKILARRSIALGKDILALEGGLSLLTEYASDDLEARSADFSVIIWNRKEYVLHGPARFINHACQPNTRLRRQGSKILVRTIRKIEEGEEITALYSRQYFGQNNRDCLCNHCRGEKGRESVANLEEHGAVCARKDQYNCKICARHITLYRVQWPNTGMRGD